MQPYRIVEEKPEKSNALGNVIGEFDSAYRAVEFMKRYTLSTLRKKHRLYLLAPDDRVLVGPDDLLALLA